MMIPRQTGVRRLRNMSCEHCSKIVYIADLRRAEKSGNEAVARSLRSRAVCMRIDTLEVMF